MHSKVQQGSQVIQSSWVSGQSIISIATTTGVCTTSSCHPPESQAHPFFVSVPASLQVGSQVAAALCRAVAWQAALEGTTHAAQIAHCAHCTLRTLHIAHIAHCANALRTLRMHVGDSVTLTVRTIDPVRYCKMLL